MLWKGCRWASKAGQVGFSSFHHGVVVGSVYKVCIHYVQATEREREREGRSRR